MPALVSVVLSSSAGLQRGRDDAQIEYVVLQHGRADALPRSMNDAAGSSASELMLFCLGHRTAALRTWLDEAMVLLSSEDVGAVIHCDAVPKLSGFHWFAKADLVAAHRHERSTSSDPAQEASVETPNDVPESLLVRRGDFLRFGGFSTDFAQSCFLLDFGLRMNQQNVVIISGMPWRTVRSAVSDNAGDRAIFLDRWRSL